MTMEISEFPKASEISSCEYQLWCCLRNGINVSWEKDPHSQNCYLGYLLAGFSKWDVFSKAISNC